MSAGNTGFGSRIIGSEAHEQAMRDQAGGAHAFGTRVRGAITGDGPTAVAKRASEFGVRTTQHASSSDAEGTRTDTLAVEDIRNMLAENPTTLDSLYELELSREGGARPDALSIFFEVERGIKGQGRQEILDEIKSLLGQKGIDAEAAGNLVAAQAQAMNEQAQREAENAKLGDLPRLRALREKQEALAIIDGSDERKAVGTTSENQVARIAAENGTPLPGDETVRGNVPAKPEGDVNPETQQPGERLGVPKGVTGDTGASTSESTTSDAAPDFENMTKAELEAYLGDDAEKVKGTGSEGAVVKADLVKAAKKKAKA